MTEAAVLGAGAWGTALANVCARAGATVLLWGRDSAEMREMERSRENRRRLPGVRLEDAVRCVEGLDETANADVLLAAVPAQALRGFLQSLPDARARPLVICAKGIERGGGAFMSEVAREILPDYPAGLLSGPSFARDVAAGLPTAVTIAFTEAGLADRLAAVLASPAFRLYSSTDVRGVEIGGAAKNVLAIACGLAVGRGLGASAVAALVARGFAEMRRFGAAWGARPETLMGLSGLGDVVLTCSSEQSRNYSLGLRLGRGLKPLEGARAELAEGVFTAQALVDLARQSGVEMPIAEAIAAIVGGRLQIAQAIERLLARPLRSEA